MDVVAYRPDQLLGERHVPLRAALLSAGEAFDDASDTNMHALLDDARAVITERSADVDRLCESPIEERAAA